MRVSRVGSVVASVAALVAASGRAAAPSVEPSTTLTAGAPVTRTIEKLAK